ncbi:ATP-binding protein [Rosenbergiella epipactidis]|uniref:ATP-binding protein n=1 Tax=Rosenbergiella epipactidis TaxID=1544694 RepID=UPI0006646C9F|nr:ATP-binding protein [Rosenbergiella epipactidis]KMV72959.1 histidine kinase [bacteria symbiont BFo2 of Frankliniella occidentalis]KYP87673.1 histidine kinase [bacteria symbiont BFo2 of Frankliniella occidentalis]KYP95153.1 histidine kinase [bacteria symbiont BFo2 of Frankliniella occidentalis]
MNQRYPRRLFTKMLVAFLFVFLLISQVIWLGFSLFAHDDGSPFARQQRSLQQVQLASITQLLAHSSGPAAVQGLVESWEPEVRPQVTLTDTSVTPNNSDEEARGVPTQISQQLHDNAGHRYQVMLDYTGLERLDERNHRSWHDSLHIPTPIMFFAPFLGIFFSLLLAWNMTRPIRQLREGFAKVSRGDLTVRLFPAMKRRYDELSTVAKDFDAMVERIDVLVKAREALLHDISHELRTPLARVQLAVGLARQSELNIPQSLDRIDLETERLDKMIGELLTLSRAEHDGIDIDQYFDFIALLEAILVDVRYEAQRPQVDVVAHYDSLKSVTVRGNAELIRRAIENVLRNALRYSTQGQVIVVKLEVDRDTLILTICDSGPGVAEDKISSIFDPFVRLQSSLSGKGYGLGLAIVRKVITAHHGQVSASNRQEGGLKISIRLPRWPE